MAFCRKVPLVVRTNRELGFPVLFRVDQNRIIQTFLAGLHTQKRNIFIRRYYYADDISEIASRYGLTENHI